MLRAAVVAFEYYYDDGGHSMPNDDGDDGAVVAVAVVALVARDADVGFVVVVAGVGVDLLRSLVRLMRPPQLQPQLQPGAVCAPAEAHHTTTI